MDYFSTSNFSYKKVTILICWGSPIFRGGWKWRDEAHFYFNFLFIWKDDFLSLPQDFSSSKERIDFFRNTFQCEVEYTKSHNTLHYGISDLNKDIHYQNYNLYVNLKPLLNKSITELYSEKIYKNTIKSILLNNVDFFPLSVLFEANKLHMSTRKLQHILNKEETNFSQIVNEVKLILGIEYLKSGKNIKEIAARLGYKEQGSFTRQFKQMTNINPMDFMSLTVEEKAALIEKLSS